MKALVKKLLFFYYENANKNRENANKSLWNIHRYRIATKVIHNEEKSCRDDE